MRATSEDLRPRMATLPASELRAIADASEEQYTAEAREAAIRELRARPVSPEDESFPPAGMYASSSEHSMPVGIRLALWASAFGALLTTAALVFETVIVARDGPSSLEHSSPGWRVDFVVLGVVGVLAWLLLAGIIRRSRYVRPALVAIFVGLALNSLVNDAASGRLSWAVVHVDIAWGRLSWSIANWVVDLAIAWYFYRSRRIRRYYVQLSADYRDDDSSS